jgi:hypothetical protein
MKSLKTATLACGLLLAFSSTLWSQNKVSIGDVFPGEVEFTAFTLGQNEKVKIDGSGGAFRHNWQMIVHYGWIIDSETRKVVWNAADDLVSRDVDLGEFEIHDEVSLDKGTYEVYFTAAFHQPENNFSFSKVNGFFSDVFADDRKDKTKVEMRTGMGMTVSASTLARANTGSLMDEKLAGAIISILKPDNNANVKKGFSLTAETTIRIYAIGEGRKEETFDYAWIYNTENHKRVWVMDYSNTDFAGGAEKNVFANQALTLPAGNYMVSYSTDDSHSYNSWNALPPNDPQFTGITIWTETDQEKKNVVAYRASEEIKPVLQLTGIGDDEYVSKGLTVKSATEFRVLCLGEESGDHEMADNGWITNAATREVVWDMNEERRDHAGGAAKNKMVDEVIRLEKGDYIVYYATDDSHAYRDWNSGPPHEQERYGITLWTTRKEDVSKTTSFEPGAYKNDKVLVEIVRVRDDANLSETFSLDKDTKLRIFAMGEGDDGELVDYGWIKNIETGKVVWEMTYRNTESAGGASKNRVFNDTVILPKGAYKVCYETDGSHSYRSWNASPPRDPERYGISLMKELN